MAISKKTAALLLAQRNKAKHNPEALFDPGFAMQTAFIKAPERLKALWCTRRSAKSYTAGLYLVYEALRTPGCNCLFIGLTRQSALDIIWKDVLKVINKSMKLNARFNESKLSMTLPNGSVISITGADSSEDEMNKLLGRKYKLVTIDEASMYTIDLRKLVYGILGPAMADLQGTICLMGTSSNFTRGLFFDITNNKELGWKLFTWTAHDNPHVARQWQMELDEIDRLRPAFKETPLYQQWYLNRWVVDTDKLVYKFNPDRNVYTSLPKGLTPNGWTYILGVDTGWEDDNAFVLCAYHEHDPILRIVDTYKKSHMTFDQVANKINEYMAHPERAPVKVIIDGANKQGVESMRQRSNIPFEYADKLGKVDFIEMLNADLVQSKVKIAASETDLIAELMGLVWKTDGDKIVLPKKEHPSLPNHLCDAFLYAWRNGFHYQFSTPLEKIPVGSPRWYEKQAEDIWEKERERLLQAEGGDWPEQPSFADPATDVLSKYGWKK